MDKDAKSRCVCSTIGAVVLVCLVGCGGRSLGKVSGVVTYKGKPLEGASVMFIAKDARPAQGTSDASGRYELTTSDLGDGAAAGEHTVIISKTEIVPPNQRSKDAKGRQGEGYEETRETLPVKYTRLMETPLKATVKPGEVNEFPFELTD